MVTGGLLEGYWRLLDGYWVVTGGLLDGYWRLQEVSGGLLECY